MKKATVKVQVQGFCFKVVKDRQIVAKWVETLDEAIEIARETAKACEMDVFVDTDEVKMLLKVA